MGRFVAGNGQYVIYAENSQNATQVLRQELQRVDSIKEKITSLLSRDGVAFQNFMENVSEENLNIHFNDESSLIYDNPENAVTKGEVRQRQLVDGKFSYDLAYRYPEIDGHNADFRLAHEMGHLVLNPANVERQTYDKATDSRQVSGLIRRTENGQFYGMQIQENAINLLAELAVRGEHSADDIMTGRVDVSEFNLYKKADDLVKLLAVSMRNDFDKEMNFEQLVGQKIDSFIEHSDGTKEPANTFFYGLVTDSSIIENEFDKYMGKGAYRDLDTAITQLHQPNISKQRFEAIFQTAQGLITEFANVRMQEKHKETVSRDGENVPSLDSKISMINEMTGIEEKEQQLNNTNHQEIDLTAGYEINEFGEIIRPEGQSENFQKDNDIPTFEPPVEQTLSFKQKIARMLQNNELLMKVPFIRSFAEKQLKVLPPPVTMQRIVTGAGTREGFANWLSNNGEYRNLPPIQRMSDPERIEAMRRKMEEKRVEENDQRQ